MGLMWSVQALLLALLSGFECRLWWLRTSGFSVWNRFGTHIHDPHRSLIWFGILSDKLQPRVHLLLALPPTLYMALRILSKADMRDLMAILPERIGRPLSSILDELQPTFCTIRLLCLTGSSL